jgi:5'(3')-deoxyribonucleotidase
VATSKLEQVEKNSHFRKDIKISPESDQQLKALMVGFNVRSKNEALQKTAGYELELVWSIFS